MPLITDTSPTLKLASPGTSKKPSRVLDEYLILKIIAVDSRIAIFKKKRLMWDIQMLLLIY